MLSQKSWEKRFQQDGKMDDRQAGTENGFRGK